MGDEDPRALCRRAELLAAAHRHVEALAVLRSALRIEPASMRAHCLAANSLLALGQPERAHDEALAAIRCDPSAPWPHRLRAAALERLLRRPAAIEAAREAVRLAPNDHLAYLQLAEMLARDGQRKAALEDARRAVSMSPTTAAPYITLSFVASACGRWRECERAARDALRIQPDSAMAMNNLGAALRHRRRHLVALSLLGRGTSVDPTEPLIRGNVNAVFVSVLGLVVALVVAVVILLAELASRSLRGIATPIAVILAAAASGALLAIVGYGTRWVRRLPRGVRNAVRDRRSWAATFNRPAVTPVGVVARLALVTAVYAVFAGICMLIVLAALFALGGPAPGQPADYPTTLFGIGFVLLTYIALIRFVVRRAAVRKRYGEPRRSARVEVEWP